jgi:protein O-GlcNAc transferase
VQAYNNLGSALSQQGHYSAASEAYEEVLKLKPDYAEGHVDLGVTLAKMGRLSDAIEQFKTALQIKPDNLSAHRDLERAQNLLQLSRGKDLSERPAP